MGVVSTLAVTLIQRESRFLIVHDVSRRGATAGVVIFRPRPSSTWKHDATAVRGVARK